MFRSMESNDVKHPSTSRGGPGNTQTVAQVGKQPWPWPFNIWQEEWPEVKKAKRSVLLCCLASFIVGALGATFLFKTFIIEGKDTTIAGIKEERDRALRDKAELSHVVEQLRIYRSSGMPIKQTALILARQIRDFSKGWKDADPPEIRYYNSQKYLHRFGERAEMVRDDLDQNGQQSDALDEVMKNFMSRNDNYQDIKTIAAEVERLANKLPD